MEWQRPEVLFLILPVLAAWLGLALFSRARRRSAARKFVDAAMAPRILPTESSSRFWLKLLCMEAALLCGLIAIAGPRFGEYFEQIKARGSDVYVMIDVSKSMLADDVPPNRLARAKSDVSSLLNTLNGERVGLIAFAGKAVVKCPLTTDYSFFRLALNDLDPNSAPRGGTAIGDAIRKGLEVFPAEAERDRAIILITDGDDQESYPLEAAAQAAERRVLVFTIGLGDSTQGARVPATRDGKITFLEHDGQQVWSKLNHGLLKDIALKTRGAYIPAGTKAYDLGQLYKDHLRSLNGADSTQTQRVRRHERFQLFLGLALFFLMLEILIKPYAQTAAAPATNSNGRAVLAALFAMLFLPFAHAGDANKALNEGMEAYKKDNFDTAVEKFTAATDALKDSEGGELPAIAAFNLACAYQRKGDTANARDQYLKAGLSKDKKIASEAHYNLGTLSADAARALAGEKPEEVPPEKREEITKHLKDAVSSFRQALNAKKDHTEARKNLELVLQWIKVYSDKWREFDRMKRREELNLPQFLDFMITAEKALRNSTRELPENARRDAFAELKRAQDELEEEIPWLNRKIKAEFEKAAQQQGQMLGQKGPAAQDPAMNKQMEEAVKVLQDWSEAAGKLMKAASEKLQERQPRPAAVAELQAVRELERIWETIAPFKPMLQRALADQTSITKTLKPDSAPAQVPVPLAPPEKRTVTNDSLLSEDVAELQEDTLRRTSLLKFKAEAELKQAEQQPAQPQPAPQPGQPGQPGQPQQPDPEKVKAGLKKAIELAPKAAEKETSALKFMKQKDFDGAYPDAEEARKILEEIAKAQPEDPQQDKKDQNKDQNKDQQKKEDQKDKKDEQKKDEQKQDPQDKKDEKKDQEQKGQPKEEKVPLNKDQLEDILRRVREREKSKMERDKKQKAILMGPGSVDKDW